MNSIALPTNVSRLAIMLAACMFLSGCKWGSMGQNGVGMQLYQQGRYPEALQQFEMARQTDPTNPDSYYNLASTYARLGQAQKDPKMLEQAEVLYNQCLELAPNHTDCYRGLAVLLAETNRSDKAFTLVQNWIKTSPTLVDPRIELSRLQSEFNQNKQAQQTLDEALAMDPNNARAWAVRGKLREDAGDTMQAVQNYQKSLALNALQPDLYQRVAALNVQMAQSTINTASSAIVASGQNTPTTTGTTQTTRY